MGKKLTDQVRQAVNESGVSRYQIARRLGIPESSLCRFMGGLGLNFDNLDALAAFLGLEVRMTKKPKGR